MNLLAIDIGNTNINVGLYLEDTEQFVKSVPGSDEAKLTKLIEQTWEKIPIAKRSKQKKRDGRIVVSSVKPYWTNLVSDITQKKLNEKILLVGRQIPYPIEISVKEPQKTGTDRVLAASAAYAVVEEAVVVADFGSAVTIDLVDDRGIFCGGVIFPGFDISASALHQKTARLPKITVQKPEYPFGKNTTEAINAGLYYSAIGTLREVIQRYAEKIGTWPKTIVTGSAADIIKQDCEFIDSFVPNLVIKGIALAYRKYLDEKE